MTIIVEFHRSSYRIFKAYYQHLLQFYQQEFPRLVSYNRFVELITQTLMPLIFYLNSRTVPVTGISFIDSTPIPICHPKRAKINNVFTGLAAWGKSSMGWFFGFKLHLIINEYGQIIAFKLTPVNVDDRVPVPDFTQNIWGYIFGDKGYIKK
ncbi:MAG: IS982 family transposase [Moorea sp. SIO2I5]|nr:IS982 family transposase [Moorena sp. SIO2I5]